MLNDDVFYEVCDSSFNLKHFLGGSAFLLLFDDTGHPLGESISLLLFCLLLFFESLGAFALFELCGLVCNLFEVLCLLSG